MRLGAKVLIRCRDVGVCPALSDGGLAPVLLHDDSLPFPSSYSLASALQHRQCGHILWNLRST